MPAPVDNPFDCQLTCDGCRPPRNTALEGQGWTWRCNSDPARALEIAAAYRDLGFAVRVEPIPRAGPTEISLATECLAQVVSIFVQRRPDAVSTFLP
jgi:hypothetical protein